ncbi:MAG: hypothetical protein M1829_006161 [Trizodia sp. TS-e1964]|nr:MAG: hypothetical protein M1829_006161 [Trizodia sp. TS-e1964]
MKLSVLALPIFCLLVALGTNSKSDYFVVFKARLPAPNEEEDYLTDWVLLSAKYEKKGSKLLPMSELYLGHAFFESGTWKSEARRFRGREASDLISSVSSYQPISYSTDPWIPYVASRVPTIGLPKNEFDGKLAWADRAVEVITYEVK